MLVQFRRIDFDQIRLYLLDDPVAHVGGQKIDNRLVNVGRGRNALRYAAGTSRGG